MRSSWQIYLIGLMVAGGMCVYLVEASAAALVTTNHWVYGP